MKKTFIVEAGKYDSEENAPTVSYSSVGTPDIQEALADVKSCSSYPWARIVVVINGKEVQTFDRYPLTLLDLI